MQLELVSNRYSKVAHIPKPEFGYGERKALCNMDHFGGEFVRAKGRKTCAHCESVQETNRRP